MTTGLNKYNASCRQSMRSAQKADAALQGGRHRYSFHTWWMSNHTLRHLTCRVNSDAWHGRIAGALPPMDDATLWAEGIKHLGGHLSRATLHAGGDMGVAFLSDRDACVPQAL